MRHLRRYQVYISDEAGQLYQYIGFHEDWNATAEESIRSRLWTESLQTVLKVTPTIPRAPANLFKVTFLGSAPRYYRALSVR